MHSLDPTMPVDGAAGPARRVDRRRRRARHLALFALGVLANLASGTLWVARGGPELALDHGFLLSVPLTAIGMVLITVALLQSSWVVERRRAAQLEVLQRAAKRMSAARSVNAVGRVVVEETRGLIDYHNARVYLLEEPDQLVPISFEGRVGAYDRVDLDLLRTTVGVGFTGWVAQHGRAIRVDDANADPRGATIPGTDDVDESMLVVPMRHDAKTVGVVTLSKLGLRKFDDEDLRLLTILADQAATALESARLLAQTRRLAAELRRLLDMSSDLSGSLDSRQVARRIAQHIGRALEVDETVISYWDRPNDRILTLGVHPDVEGPMVAQSFALEGFPLTRSVLERQRIEIVDVENPEADPGEVALLRGQGMRSLIMLPLIAKGESIGLAELLSRTGALPDAARLELAQTMANEAGMALENARLYEDARRLADRDPLTGFYNHRYLHERLGEEIVRAQRTKRPLTVLMLDLDDFKLVNDTFGHLFGDRVLVHVAERIRSVLRASDIPARYGGDEFAIVLPETDAEAAQRVVERIDEVLAASPYEAEGRLPVTVAATVGSASHPADGRTATELIATADRDLYAAKAASDGGPASQPAGPVGARRAPAPQAVGGGLGRSASA